MLYVIGASDSSVRRVYSSAGDTRAEAIWVGANAGTCNVASRLAASSAHRDSFPSPLELRGRSIHIVKLASAPNNVFRAPFPRRSVRAGHRLLRPAIFSCPARVADRALVPAIPPDRRCEARNGPETLHPAIPVDR